jgi:hypothetical protein
MGQSTNAYLFYGIESDDEHTDRREVLETLGLLEKGDDEDDDYYDMDGWLPEGIKGDSHCSGEYSIPLICIEETYMSAWRGYPQRFDKLPEVDEEKAKLLAEYAEKLGWAPPSWMIVSWWC